MPAKTLSVIIVNYNVKDFLYQCLMSIRKAVRDLNAQIIVVDNNSSDNSIKFLQPEFPEVEFIALSENLGFAKANNIGIKKASGEYILILNPDTILEEDNLSEMLSYMESHSEVGIAGCKVLNSDGTFQLSCRRGFPTPWASFCKLFALQSLFPKSKLFAKYNMTYKSIDETYYIDSVMGAYMFCRANVIRSIGGFDQQFFMYGEDLDLCFRAKAAGWKVSYVHTTSIIHFKGESTKRSSINDVTHFYKAMEIFTRKNYSKSFPFLYLLKAGIIIRQIFAYILKYKQDFFAIFYDLFVVNLSLIIATKIKFGRYFGFPEHAYPTVFIVVSLVIFGTMLGTGDYFESRPTLRKSSFSLFLSFFILSSLTYFFKDYAFSRGVLLMTIGSGLILTGIYRVILSIKEKVSSKEDIKRIIIIGTTAKALEIANSIKNFSPELSEIVGFVETESGNNNLFSDKILGNFRFLPQIISDNNVNEVIICDDKFSSGELINIIIKMKRTNVRFHMATVYEDLIASEIINEFTGAPSDLPKYNITYFRYRIVKRAFDLFISIFFLTIGYPLLNLLFPKANAWKDMLSVLAGRKSFIGIFQFNKEKPFIGKSGLIGLAHGRKPDTLSAEAINKLNEYYLKNYSLSLDFRILIKKFTGKI